MNKKMTVLAGAGVGVLALSLLGGGTFAVWSDYDTVDDVTLAAGTLVIEVDEDQPISFGNLAPGENKFQDLYIANRSDDTDALENARLTLRIVDLVGTENGCDSNGERDAASDDCENGGAGQFATEAVIQFAVADAPGGVCGSFSNSVQRQGVLADVATRTLDLGTVNPGDGKCVRVEAGLPSGGVLDGNDGVDFANGRTSTNASQGDSADFDLRFDLEQVLPN